MKSTVKLPRLADTVDEVTILEWEVAAGATVAVGDVLLRVETDKAIVDVPSPIAGIVIELLVEPGADVATGTAIVAIEAVA
jgi:pyruvate/2-oxoglutarate dehydrogenase complex dihydrolipoamide acyltransferase (E2) component